MNAEILAWELLRLVVEGYDDNGIILHGRIFNQGDIIRLDFISAYDLISFGQSVPKDMLQNKAHVQQWAEVMCEKLIPNYRPGVSKVKPSGVNLSTYQEKFRGWDK